MFEFLNWHDTGILWHYNWPWFVLALALGAWTGYRTCEYTRSNDR
jgi:hypothetical protein